MVHEGAQSTASPTAFLKVWEFLLLWRMDRALQKRLFSSLDVDGDGGISLAELQLALKTNQEFAALPRGSQVRPVRSARSRWH